MVKIQNYNFEGPFNLTNIFDDVPGIYAIYTSQIWLDVGETDKLGQRLNGNNHERKQEWIIRSMGSPIGIAFLRVENGELRLQVESYLRRVLNPVCGDK